MKFVAIVTLLWASRALGQNAIPAGTVLPAALNSSLNSRKTALSKTITARIMQEVPLPDSSKISAGTKLIGRVMSVQAATNTHPAEVAIQFDRLKIAGAEIPVRLNLRALASLREVED